MIRIHPRAAICDVAVNAYGHGYRVHCNGCKVYLAPGRDLGQYLKALTVQALQIRKRLIEAEQ